MRKLSLLILMVLLPMMASADKVEIDGIYYNLITKAKEAEVTSNPNLYSGDVIIPKTVKYEGVSYNVKSIGDHAFSGCKNMTSITIASSITFIGQDAFWSCDGLTAVHISDIAAWCKISYASDWPHEGNPLYYAHKLYLNGEEVKDLIIPDGVTFIGANAFYSCESLTSVTLPNSVTGISTRAFYYCSSLTSVIIGSGVSAINGAFSKCIELTDVFCYAKDVPDTQYGEFGDSYIEYATLHVPSSSIDKYKAISPWKNFKEIVKIDMPEHTLTYKVDGEVYKTYIIEDGETITPEPAPTKEGLPSLAGARYLKRCLQKT